MHDVENLRITGLDPARPPRIRKEPYIDLYFTLEPVAPPRWCADFNDLATASGTTANINPKQGTIIETWVRKPEEIATRLSRLQSLIEQATKVFMARAEAEAAALQQAGIPLEDQGEQGRLNAIVAALDFGPQAR